MATDFTPFGMEIYADQHGREWQVRATTMVDGSVAPTGPWSPRGWSVPDYLLPPHDFIKPLPRDGAVQKCRIDYEPLIAMRRQTQDEYDRLRDTLMQQQFGDALTVDTPVPASIRRALGNPPAAWQLMDAARQGNRWALTGEGEVPRKLVPFVPVSRTAATTWDDDEADYDDEGALAGVATDAAAERRAKDAERKRAARAAAKGEA